MKMNQSKFAELVGCSQQNISKLIKKGTLVKGEDKKLDVEKSLLSLREFGLLDENNKLIKSRTPKKEEKKAVFTSSLPLNGEVSYSSLADLTDEQREVMEKEEIAAFKEFEEKKKEAASKDIDTLDDDLREFNYSTAKAHRENYLAKTAELDFKIKMGEYIPREVEETTFFEAARTVRDSLLAYPNKMAIRVVGKTDIREIAEILMEEIQITLGNLSK